ncbi:MULTISPECIES: type IV pilus modification protein PilV [Halomonas]|uniref:Type IV pilus assembly protein PilV n=1 Tax=Halomonas ventosae TaxID=229007 RepID=A0A4R6HQF0_9GAMM|nr:type IV pilus modification protein PilV [Halomonas ventosae]TDO10525.1 type IV pilus assembly protein PilV [Halomonas ventosae]
MARQAGITLIESLVALLLISVALLGVAGLQLLGLQDARDARWRADAVSLATSVADTMRAYSGPGYPDTASRFEVSGDAATIAACNGSNDEICALMKDWKQEVARLLPNARPEVSVQSGDVEKIRIMLRWRQRPPNDDNPLPTCGVEARSGGCVILETRL